MPADSLLGLGKTIDDLGPEECLRLVVRRIAELTSQVARLADAQELQLKLQLIKEGLTVEAVKSAEWADAAAPPPPGKPAVELLTQTTAEIDELDSVEQAYLERFGKPSLDLDLYAEREKMAPDNPEEAV